jgi:UrcA family protein
MRLLPRAAFAAAGLAAAAFAVPTLAQTVEELTVTGHTQRNSPQTLSETVSYADLDLTQKSQRTILERRVSDAAGRVCDRLNQDRPGRTNLGHSCQEVAIRGASDQMRLAFADAREVSRLAAAAPAAGSYATPTSAVIPAGAGMAPIPDTRANRARYGGPMSHAGRRSGPDGR